QRQDDHGDGGGPGQREQHVPELVQRPGAVDARGLEVLLRDRHDPGHVDDGGEPDPLPHVDQRDRQQRERRVGEPPRPRDPDGGERLVDRPPNGSISTWKVIPTPIGLTSTGKNTTERRNPRAMICEVSSTPNSSPSTTLRPEVTTP